MSTNRNPRGDQPRGVSRTLDGQGRDITGDNLREDRAKELKLELTPERRGQFDEWEFLLQTGELFDVPQAVKTTADHEEHSQIVKLRHELDAAVGYPPTGNYWLETVTRGWRRATQPAAVAVTS